MDGKLRWNLELAASERKPRVTEDDFHLSHVYSDCSLIILIKCWRSATTTERQREHTSQNLDAEIPHGVRMDIIVINQMPIFSLYLSCKGVCVLS